MTQTTAAEHYATLKDGNVFYLSRGQGPPLVLLHPSSQSSWVWHRVLGPLSEHFQCFALDMPGYGRSDVPPSGYSIGRFSEAIIEFMDRVGIAKAHIMGQRTGAMVSFELAAAYPERVNKLILVSCPAWTKEEGLTVLERLRRPMMDKHGVLQPQPHEVLVAGEPYLDRAWAERETEAVRNAWRLVHLHSVGHQQLRYGRCSEGEADQGSNPHHLRRARRAPEERSPSRQHTWLNAQDVSRLWHP